MRSASLQQELKLTDKQKATLNAASDKGRAQRQAIANDRDAQDPRNRSEDEHQASLAQIREQLRASREENGKLIAQLRSPTQHQRLQQIVLQIKGPIAVAEPEIAEAIGLEEIQLAQAKQIVAEMTAFQQQIRQTHVGQVPKREGVEASAGERQPARKAKSGESAESRATEKGALRKAKTDDKATRAKDATDGGRAQATPTKDLRTEHAGRIQKSIDESEEARREAVKRMGAVLSQSQKTAFNRLLGKRLDDLTVLLPDSYAEGVAGQSVAPSVSSGSRTEAKTGAKPPEK
jgi:hypothetical protein